MYPKQFLENVISKMKYCSSLKNKITVKHPAESFALCSQTITVHTQLSEARNILISLCMGASLVRQTHTTLYDSLIHMCIFSAAL